MESSFEVCAQGQLDEGKKWLKPEEIPEALKNSYENIKLLFEEENSWRSFYL
jgi:hypothetical protein